MERAPISSGREVMKEEEEKEEGGRREEKVREGVREIVREGGGRRK